MTNATKTLAIIFAGSLLLAFAVSWGGGASSSAAFQKELLSVDTSAVQAVRVERQNGPDVRLARTSDGWSVGSLDTTATYPASAQAVRELFDLLPELEVIAVATRQSEKHPRYGVDSTGTVLTMLGTDDTKLGQLIVGRTHMQQRSGPSPRQAPFQQGAGSSVTYVRDPDAPDVYSVEQPIRSLTDRAIDDWREKQLWSVDRSQIQRIDFAFPADSSFTMERVSDADTASAPSSDAWVSAGDTLSTRVSSLLRTLSSPEAQGFVDDMRPADFGEALYQVRLHLADGTEKAIRLRPDEEGDQYIAVVDDYPYVVELPMEEWNNSVLQGRSELLPVE